MKKKLIVVSVAVAVIVAIIIFSRPELDETKAFKILETGRNYYSRNNFGGAMEQFRLLLKKYPSSKFAEESQRFVIYIYEKRQDYVGAIDEYKKYLKKFRDAPSTAEFSYKTGFVLYKFLSKPEQARIVLMRVIKEYPETEWSIKAKELLAEIYKATGKEKELIEFSQKYPEKNNEYLNVSNMEVLWRQGKHREAYEFAVLIPKKSPQVKENTIYWQLLIKFEPKKKDNLLGLSNAYQQLGFDQQAKQWKTKAEKLSHR